MNLEQVKHGRDTHYTMTFESWQEYVENAQKPRHDPSKREARSHDAEPSFFGTSTWEQAIDFATKGWSEGLREIKRLSGSLIEKLGHKLRVHDIRFDVSGTMYDIGKLCEGDPECWVNFDEVDTEAPTHTTAHVYFNASVSAGVDKSEMYKRGAVAVALCELLELSGVHVRLDYVVSVSSEYNNAGNTIDCIVPVKDYTQDMDLDRLAFVMCNAAPFRRFWFATCEQFTSTQMWNDFGGAGHYGFPATFTANEPEALVIDKVLLGTDTHIDTDKVLLTCLSRYGITLNEE